MHKLYILVVDQDVLRLHVSMYTPGILHYLFSKDNNCKDGLPEITVLPSEAKPQGLR